jgi:hypothetical protein
MRTPRPRRLIGDAPSSLAAAAATVAAFCAGGRASAQDDAASAAQAAAEIAAGVSSNFACKLDVRGEPRFDGLEKMWLVPYTASGTACDAAAAELRRLAPARALVFFRRPDANQVRVLIASIRASVEPAFHCPISLRGEPLYDEGSGYWSVSYVASGPGCGDAAVELSRLGEDYQIQFQPSLQSQDLLR